MTLSVKIQICSSEVKPSVLAISKITVASSLKYENNLFISKLLKQKNQNYM